MKVVSFIIPSYNAEPYLTKCLESFLHPECLGRIEVVIVNDGSKDGTRELAERYVEQYPEVFRLINKENGGHGSAINAGASQIRGRYMKVIDADDWVITENLPYFLDYLEESDADVVLTPFYFYDINTEKRRPQRLLMEANRCYSMEELVKDYRNYQLCLVFHAITYRTEFYRRYGVKLTEHVFYEDQEYNAVPFCHAEKIAALSCFLYEYRVGNASQSIAYENQAARIGDVEQIAGHLMAYYRKDTGLSDAGKQYLMQKLCEITLIYYASACIYEKDKKKGREESRRFHRQIAARIPQLQRRVQKRYRLYRILNYMAVSPERYRDWMDSDFYDKIKRTFRWMKQMLHR